MPRSRRNIRPLVRRWVEDKLESGAWQGPLGRALARSWSKLAEPVRRVTLPEAARVIGVGGVRLGGDGKTAVVLELARRLRRTGQSVAVLARCYPCTLGRPRTVLATDSAALVGDEPLMLARALALDGVPVVAGSDYTEGLSHAASLASTVIVDGLLQTAPERLGSSLLVVGRGPLASRCPPAGDLRADFQRSLEAADCLLLESGAELPARVGSARLPVLAFESSLDGLSGPHGAQLSLGDLRTRRVGVVLSLARPERVLTALGSRGVRPAAVDLYADHDPLTRARRRSPEPDVELWVTSRKCRVKLTEVYRGAPLWTLEHRINLPPSLIADLPTQIASHPESPW